MDSPDGQPRAPRADRIGAASTRLRLLNAAAALIAEVGWGRVTTRAVAENAGVPHGAVSYHFSGKQSLLVDAAILTVEEMLSESGVESIRSIEELLQSATAANSDRIAASMSVLLEAMRESTRDPVLRERMAGTLRRLRARVAELIRPGRAAESDRVDPVAPSAVAAAVVAAGDGLWLHAQLDPEFDASDAVTAIRVLLLGQPERQP